MFTWLKRKKTSPDANAVMARVIILKYMYVKGLATPPSEYLAECKQRWADAEWNKFLDGVRVQNAKVVGRLKENGLWKAMERDERRFIEAGPIEVNRQTIIDMSWLTEPIICLLWALGYIGELLSYDQQADDELTNKLPAERVEILLKKAALRPHESIEKQRDLAELWHWRSRTRQLQESGEKFTFPGDMTIEKVLRMSSAQAALDGLVSTPIGDDFPAFGKAYRDLTAEEYSKATSIAIERHRAFNWLCGLAPNNRWTETPTDT
jgi:hypothetical protein